MTILFLATTDDYQFILYSTDLSTVPSGDPCELVPHAGPLTSQLATRYTLPQHSAPFYEDYWQNPFLVPSSSVLTEVNRGKEL